MPFSEFAVRHLGAMNFFREGDFLGLGEPGIESFQGKKAMLFELLLQIVEDKVGGLFFRLVNLGLELLE